jgi:hypothetical protein
LLARGADRSIRDRLCHGIPFNRAQHSGLDLPELKPQVS